MMQQFIKEEIEKIKSQSNWRFLSESTNCRSNEIILDGKKYLNFSTNDYLGYSHHPQLIQASQDALNKYGTGGRSSRLIAGTLDLHKELEQNLAKFKGTESALVFPTGFMANLGVISALLGSGAAIIMDRLNHASLIDAAKLAGCRIFVYEHCNIGSLEKVLHRTKPYKKRLVVTDSIFSMDGDFAPLREVVDLCQQDKVWLMIDDAHATGIFGENGVGMAEHFGLLGKIEIVMGTLSKALGSQGGFVCGSNDLIDYLVNRSRTFIYTTALSPASCASALKALSLIKEEPEKRTQLLFLSQQLRQKIKTSFPSQQEYLNNSNSHIIPFQVGSSCNVIALSNHLKKSRIFAPAIRPPTVPKNECRLRISLTSDHTEKDIQKLVEALKSETNENAKRL